ncbi:MAG: hypothetical protein IKC72_01865 [Clostridia bacterium]|nr:hypothetical protein [Clostridia bacterium]
MSHFLAHIGRGGENHFCLGEEHTQSPVNAPDGFLVVGKGSQRLVPEQLKRIPQSRIPMDEVDILGNM